MAREPLVLLAAGGTVDTFFPRRLWQRRSSAAE